MLSVRVVADFCAQHFVTFQENLSKLQVIVVNLHMICKQRKVLRVISESQDIVMVL